MKKQVKQATDMATGGVGTTAGVALGGTGGYQLWKSFWEYLKALDTTVLESGEIITGQKWEALEPLLTNIYIFLAMGGAVALVHFVKRLN